MVCEVSCIMGFDDPMSCLGINSMDLYSKIKFRGLNGKVNVGRHGNLGLYNVKPMSSGSGKSREFAVMKSRMISKRECKILTINSGGELATNWGNSQGYKRTWKVAYTERKTDIPYSDREGNRRGVTFETGRSSEEETAIEVLGSLKVTRSETMAIEFKVGDLVWGKIETHPWWPGYIYEEALADSLVMQTKTEGFLLVSFFGDDTYSWIHPNNLLPYEPHFLSKSKQSKSDLFEKAVKDAIYEVQRRENHAFTCECRKPSSGDEEGATYPVDQIKRFRREWQPEDLLSFVQKLALGPMDLTRDGPAIRNVARVLARRKAVFAEEDITYKETHVDYQENGGGWDSDGGKKALPQGAGNANVSERAEVPAPKRKREGSSSGHSRPNKACGKSKRAKVENAIVVPKLPETDCGKASGDLVSRNWSKSRERNQNAFLDKEALVSKPSKPLASIVPIEKALGKSGGDTPRSRNKDKDLGSGEGAEATIVNKQALISKPSQPPSSILFGEKAEGKSVREPPSRSTIEEKELTPSKDAEADIAEPGAMLHIKFPPQAPMPSTSELKARFARFGRLDTSATYSSRIASKCHVAFKKTSDAEAARDHLQRHGDMYNTTKVTCHLEGLEVSPSPKSSESSKLLGNAFTNAPHQLSASSGERASRSEVGGTSTLVSSEVNWQEGRAEKYQQAIPPSAMPPVPVYPELFSREALCQFAAAMNKKHLEMTQTAATTSTSPASSTVDISGPMLTLLNKLSKVVEDVMRTQKDGGWKEL